VVPGPGLWWESAGNTTALAATPSPGDTFSGWSGTGPSSVTASSPDVSVTTTSAPITEVAEFSVPPAGVRVNLTLHETGLAVGVPWSFTVGPTGGGGSAVNTTVEVPIGTYVVTVPTVSIGPGEQFISNVSELTVPVAANTTIPVGFTEQFRLTIVAGIGGTATPASEWATAGSTVSVEAAPNAGYTFVGWTSSAGTGGLSGSQAIGTVAVSGPVTETAQFAPRSVGSSSSASSGVPAYVPWVALVGLLAVGLLAILVLGGARRPRTPARHPAAVPGVAPAAAKEDPYDDEDDER
jgi:uncharacterized repeat protein (TIGR02543 family)